MRRRRERVGRGLALRRRSVSPCRPIRAPIVESAHGVGVPTGSPHLIVHAQSLRTGVVHEQERAGTVSFVGGDFTSAPGGLVHLLVSCCPSFPIQDRGGGEKKTTPER